MLHTLALGVLAGYGTVPEGIVLEPRTVRFRYHDWDRKIRKETDTEFLNVDRAGFDHWLLGLLPDTVQVADRTSVTGFSQDETGVLIDLDTADGPHQVRADLLVGADGARSQVRRTLAISDSSSYVTLQDFVALEGAIDPVFDCIYMRDIGDEFAYAYVVPKGPVAIVGSVFYPRTKRPWQKQDQVLEILRTRLPQLGESRLREASAALHLRSPEDVLPGHGRVLLAGEAGGFMSPTSGEGISWALRTGRAAGIAAAGDPAGALVRYTAAVAPVVADLHRRFRWLPLMESRAGKYVAGFVPTPIVSRVTRGL
jgi:flavin-dependent dehydrogenase